MAGWVKMPLSMEVGLGPGDFVLDGDPAPLPKRCVLDEDPAPPPQKGGGPASPIFGTCPLWSNGWMDQDGTWRGGGPWSGHIVLDGDPAPVPQKWDRAPQFLAHL